MDKSNFLIQTFLEMLVSEKGVAQNTVIAYHKDLKEWTTFLSLCKAQKPLDQVNLEDVQDYLVYLNEKGIGARSVARKLSSLRQFYDFQKIESQQMHSPLKGVSSPRYFQPLPRDLSLETMKSLIQKAKEDVHPEGRRLHLIVEMLYATGMRISELITLPYASLLPVLEKEAPLLIQGKGGHERYVLFHASCLKALSDYLMIRPFFLKNPAKENNYLFPSSGKEGHLTRQRVGQMLKELAFKANVDPSFVMPHAIRHAFATHLLQQGIDLVMLKELLGHVDISTTQIYTRVNTSELEKVLKEHHPLSKKQSGLI